MNKVTVIAVSVDSANIVLYKQDGGTILIQQGDPRVTGIMEAVKEPLARNEPVEISLAMPGVEQTQFAEAEKQTNGLIRFFRVAKETIKGWFDGESPDSWEAPKSAYVSPTVLGVIPGTEPEYFDITLFSSGEAVATVKAIRNLLGSTLQAASDIRKGDLPRVLCTGVSASLVQEAKISFEDAGAVIKVTPSKGTEPNFRAYEDGKAVTQIVAAVKVKTNEEKLAEANARMDILEGKGVTPADPAFHTKMDPEKETVVAVVGNKVIPDAHKLSKQLGVAVKLKDFTGFTAFVDRVSKIIDKRGHSVEDLMKFMEKADLPIADDGCIVIYKRLKPSGNDIFVDVHSGKVKQKVGSLVFMDEKLVDPNRRQDCSNGLHVATLGYLSSFSGDVTIIGKVKPEDVIAVPQYDATKMRVCAYHIVGKLTNEQRDIVNRGGKLSDAPGGLEVLNAVLRGKHIGVTQTVQIGGQKGTNLTITDLDTPVEIDEVTQADLKNTNITITASGEPEPEPSAPVKATDIKPVSAPIETKPVKETKAQAAQRLYGDFKSACTSTVAGNVAMELIALKKASKKSWLALGLSEAIGGVLTQAAQKAEPPVKVETVNSFDNLKETKPKAPKAQSFTSPVKGTGPKAKITELLKGSKIDTAKAVEIYAIKKSAKKSWSALGISDEVAALIESLAK